MGAFDRLSPALQVQIVNQLGWTTLRPVQEQASHAILDGANCVVLAPTAGGKTEAAFFPLLTAMHEEDWRGPSVLYIAPIRALLNNQEARLERLSGLLGRRAFKWHGDVGAAARRRFVSDPADILAITPESLEAMLLSTRVPGKALLSRVRAVVIDEVHAFAADDRGAHLVAVLQRISKLAGQDLQRVGLSATVGDPEAILTWLSADSQRPRRVVDPGGAGHDARLRLDYVGHLDNAALMIDKLFPGSKRLVFVDSRRRVEALGSALATRGVEVYLSHSSLAVSERRAAERAFEEGQSCVIVATSALELGIDVGELDHVIQLDAPATVASFLQRMGRTGRRPGAQANCTFLCTTEEATVQAAALLRLHAAGFVEPTTPSRRAAHVLAHQLLALGLQETGISQRRWFDWLEGCAAFDGLSLPEREALLTHNLREDILAEVDGRLILGDRGRKLYAGRNFQELYAVFSAPPVLTVMHGNQEVGTIDAWFLRSSDETPTRFVLAGRAWVVSGVRWRGGICHVQPAESGRYPRWMGRPMLLSRELCQSVRSVLADDAVDAPWSKRATQVIAEQREAALHTKDAPGVLVHEGERVRWWTYAGGKANALLAGLLQEQLGEKVIADNLQLSFVKGAGESEVAIRQARQALAERGVSWEDAARLAPDAARGQLSKFQPCLPEALERDLLARGLMDVDGARRALGEC